MKLVLHGGTPKTGTKALQRALYQEAGVVNRGVWYPPAGVEPSHKKHQFLVDLLLSGDAARFARVVETIASTAAPETHTVVLSTEGLFNHWWDFPPESKAMLRDLDSVFDCEIWICFRDPISYALSLHAQLLRNPRRFSPAYGLDVSLDEILENEWFARRLDYGAFVRDVDALFGPGKLRLFRYDLSVVDRIFQALGLPVTAAVDSRANPSVRSPGVALLRIVNRYDLPAEEKEAAAALVLELDRLIGDRAEPLQASAAATARIRSLNGDGWSMIQERLRQTDHIAPACTRGGEESPER